MLAVAVARFSSDSVAFDMLCRPTSVFLNDVMFSYHGANWPESSTTLCLEEVRHVAAPVGRQTNSVWLSSSECGTVGEVCYLRLP